MLIKYPFQIYIILHILVEVLIDKKASLRNMT